MPEKSKREHGTGSISLRKDGTWTARIQIGTQANGKLKIKAFYGKTKSEVKKNLKEFIRNINNLPQSELKKVSFETYIKNWRYIPINTMI